MTTSSAQDSPLISVIIPTRNRANLLERAVKSVLNQKFKDFEIIIINDGSTDHTERVLKKMAEDHKNITYSTTPEPKGACNARNTAIKLSRGKFITNLDDDDQFSPVRLNEFMMHFSQKWSFLCSGYEFKGEKLNYKSVDKKSIINYEDIKNKNQVGNSAFVLKSRLEAVGLYDENMKSWQDYDLWFRLIKEFGPALKLPNHSYLVDVQTSRTRISTSSNAYLGYRQFIDKHKNELSQNNLREQALNDMINRSEDFSIKNLFAITPSFSNIIRIAKLTLRTRTPNLYNTIVKLIISLKKA